MTNKNEDMKLSLHPDALDRNCGSLDVSTDFDSSCLPTTWIWLTFNTPYEPWFRLTFAEAAELRDRLSDELVVYDTLTDEQKRIADTE